ncbi:protein of unknown function [Methylacidimicrobium sp. AP8]|nr:protein of unknown function [Methylacidimicrobium sp. AP8]
MENLRPPRTQAHLRRLGYEICEKWPLGESGGGGSASEALGLYERSRPSRRRQSRREIFFS